MLASAPSLPLALQTAGDAVGGALPFGLEMADLQTWTLIYLGLSSLGFVAVWVVGLLRR
ncbi:MAG: cytochrome B6 [Cyanobium sp.]